MLADTLATAHFELGLVGRAVREGKLDLGLKLIDGISDKLREAGMAAAVVAHAEPLVLREAANDDAPDMITVIWGTPLSATAERPDEASPALAAAALQAAVAAPGTRSSRLLHGLVFAMLVIVLPAAALVVFG